MCKYQLKVISLGGSLVVPEKVDISFLQGFTNLINDYLQENVTSKLIFVVGGGATARLYQQAASTLSPRIEDDRLDLIGIAATRINAQLVRSLFPYYALCPVAENPETATFDEGRILVASGWKPGFSTDFDAVVLAERFRADSLINLSNIDAVYTADPKQDATAQPLKTMNWTQLKAMVGTQWIPGGNWPFDPVATARASQSKLRVIVTKGSDLENLKNILEEKEFTGTTIVD